MAIAAEKADVGAIIENADAQKHYSCIQCPASQWKLVIASRRDRQGMSVDKLKCTCCGASWTRISPVTGKG